MNTIDENNNGDLTNLSVHKNRRSLILLITVFVLPILLAKLALNNQWISTGITNQGKLLTQPLTLSELGIDNEAFAKQWLIIYRPPNNCSTACLQSIETIHNSYVSLGKDMPRVTPVLLNNNNFSHEQNSRLAESQWLMQTITPNIESLLAESQVVIVDPLGNLILRHSPPHQVNVQGEQSNKQQADFGKGIITDMKKLLKYSKVG